MLKKDYGHFYKFKFVPSIVASGGSEICSQCRFPPKDATIYEAWPATIDSVLAPEVKSLVLAYYLGIFHIL